MKSYDEIVTDLICFLRSKNVCPSSVNSHIACYQQFQQFVHDHERRWEPAAVSDWIIELKKKRPSQLCTVWNMYMQQLEEFLRTGIVLDRHLYLNRSTYERLSETMKTDLDDYLASCKDHYTEKSWILLRNKLAGMLIYFEDRGRCSVPEISYQDIIAYQTSKFCCSDKERAVYLGHGRRFFEFMSGHQKCPLGYALLLNDRYAPYVGCLDKFEARSKAQIAALSDESQGFPANELFDSIEGYIESLKSHGYADTSIKTAKHALVVLYLFLEINSLGYHPGIASTWFSEVKPVLPKNWKHWRRLISLFSEFVENGDIIPTGKYTYNPTAIDSLPEWCTSRIEEYLDLLRREFHDNSTIRTYRYPCIRLCRYLMDHNHAGFDTLCADDLQNFCLQDHHETFRGKSSCLTIIRRFLIFLEDTGYIKNKYLHLS